MPIERRRSKRHPFQAMAEITDESENSRTASRITDLSIHGCYVEMSNPFPPGRSVLIEIFTDDEFVEAHATVAYLHPREGMGLEFTDLPAHFASVLHRWVHQAAHAKPN